MSPHARFEHADWSGVPSHLHAQLERYLAAGQMPRSKYLAAVLVNDLFGAFAAASFVEKRTFASTVDFLRQDCPAGCCGSPYAVRDWTTIGGYAGTIRMTEKKGGIYGR